MNNHFRFCSVTALLTALAMTAVGRIDGWWAAGVTGAVLVLDLLVGVAVGKWNRSHGLTLLDVPPPDREEKGDLPMAA